MNRLKQLRKELNKSMADVARDLNIPYTTYVNYEKEAREPNSETLIALADYFHCSVDFLICRSDERINADNSFIFRNDKNIEPLPKMKKVPLLDTIDYSHTKKKRPMTLSEKVRRKRIEAGLSIEDLSKASGINIDELKQCELGNITPTISKNLSNLAKALNVEPVELLPDSTDNDLYKVADYNNNKIKQLTSDEKTLLDNYRDLNNKGKEKLIDYSDDLKGNSKYSDEHKK